MTPNFKLILCDTNAPLANEWKRAFADHPEVEIRCSGFESVDFDCIVSPANSFGLMDGGIDGAITDYFGKQMMDRVQSYVLRRYAGEQPVGTSMIVRATDPLSDKKLQFVAHTPTMIVPRDISKTTNVYMAMKAMLLAVEEHNRSYSHKIGTVLCSGLGTGAGRVPYNEAANDMAKAYTNFKIRPKELNWTVALNRYKQIVDKSAPQPALKCHCGEPVDMSDIDCIAMQLCKEHIENV